MTRKLRVTLLLCLPISTGSPPDEHPGQSPSTMVLPGPDRTHRSSCYRCCYCCPCRFRCWPTLAHHRPTRGTAPPAIWLGIWPAFPPTVDFPAAADTVGSPVSAAGGVAAQKASAEAPDRPMTLAKMYATDRKRADSSAASRMNWGRFVSLAYGWQRTLPVQGYDRLCAKRPEGKGSSTSRP